MTNTPTEKLDFKKILPILVIIFVDLLGLSIIIPLLPLYAARYGADAFVVGLLSAAYPFMQFIGAPMLGRLSDRFGRRPVLLASQAGTLSGFILLAFANSLPLLFLSRIIDGLSGANIATAQAVVSDVTSDKTRTQGLGLIGAAFGLGFIMGPIIAFITLAATGGNYQAVAFAAAFFSLVSILLTFFWLPETLDREKAAAYRAQRAFSLQNLVAALRRPQIGILLILMGVQQLAFGGYEQFFSLFTLNRLGMGATDTSGLFVLAGLFIVVIQGGFVGRWSRKYGDRWLVMMGLAALSAGLILTALTPQIPVWWYDRAKITAEVAGDATRSINVPLPPEENKGWLGITWMLLASVPAAIGGGVLHPAINSLLTKSADSGETGGTLGLSSSMYSLGNAIAPLFYGTLFQAFGAPTPFILGGLLLGALWIVATRTVRAPQTAV